MWVVERKWRKLDSSCRVHPLFLNFLITDATLLSSLFPSLFHVPLLCSPYPFFHDHTQTELQKWWNCIYLKFENIKWNSLNITKKNLKFEQLRFFFFRENWIQWCKCLMWSFKPEKQGSQILSQMFKEG